MKIFFIIVALFFLNIGCKVSDEILPDEDNLKTDKDSFVFNDNAANDETILPDEITDQATTDKETDEDSFYEPDEPLQKDENSDPDDVTVSDDELDVEIFDEDTENSTCPVVEKPESVSEDPLDTVSDVGIYESVTNGSFTDHFLYSNSAKEFKIGVREQWGSSIVFLGFANNVNSNVIDANDTGREVQIAIYDLDRITQNCAHNASCKTTPSDCAGGITYLGWNPVQGGNRCNNGSPTESISGKNGTMTASVVPNQWNPAWDRTDCFSDICNDPSYKFRLSDMRYIQKIRWVGANIVEIKMTINNLTDIERGSTLQEFPTLYVPYGKHGLQNYNTLLDSNGTQIAIDQPANDGFFVKNFSSPGAWTTLQTASKEYGVGIYYENRLTDFQGWQKADVFNNVRSRIEFGLPANGTVSARAYLVLGGFSTVKSLTEALDISIAPFGHMDQPAEDAEITGNSISVSGWTLDNKGVTKIEVFIDGTSKGQIPINTPRADVCKAWPGYSMCPNAGYSGNIDISTLTNCAHIIEIKVTDTDSNVRTIAKKRFYKKL